MRLWSTLGALLLASAVPAAAERAALEPVPLPAAGAAESFVYQEIRDAHEAVTALAQRETAEPMVVAQGFAELGQLYAAYELWDPAGSSLRNATTLASGAAGWWYLPGYVEQRRGGLQEAASAFEQASRLDPENAAIWLRLGETELLMGADEAATTAFSRALASPAHAAAAHFGLGRLAVRAGDTATAVEQLVQALDLQPTATQIHYPLAQIYRRQNRLELAQSHLELQGTGQVLFEDPWVEDLSRRGLGAAAQHLRGDRAAIDGRFSEAVAAYREAVAADPQSIFYRRSLGLALFQTGDIEGAARELETALTLSPGLSPAQRDYWGAEIRYNLAGLAVYRGDLERAIELHRSVIALDPGHAGAHLYLGDLLLKSGNREEAVVNLRRAVELDPDDPRARQLLERALPQVDR
ncbi:MAG: tetratricopeptide repeat protein [Thermoanaerobaculia bacterium]